MFSLLLLLIMNIQKVDEVTIQQVQQTQEQQISVATVDRAGRVDRPINQRTQIVNSYLDTCIATDTTTVSNITQVIISSYSYDKIGNLVWDKTDGRITIPVQWTYMILVRTTRQVNPISNGDYLVRLLKNGTGVETKYDTYEWLEFSQEITTVKNLVKWDYLQVDLFQARNGTADTADATTTFTVIKLS